MIKKIDIYIIKKYLATFFFTVLIFTMISIIIDFSDRVEDFIEEENPSVGRVIEFSLKLTIHPAIIAGRVRYEKNNYRLLSHFVGSGEVKKHFINN